MKIEILYGSTTGTTEEIAGQIKENLSAYDVTVRNVSNFDEEALKEADLVLLGSSTWGYGELQDDFADYIDLMTEDVYKDKQVAVFGAGDSVSFADVFCEAIAIITDKLAEVGATIIAEPLRIDVSSGIDSKVIETFTKQF
jgi:flavodoxin I